MNNFFVGPEIIYGENTLNYLEQLEGSNIFIMADPSIIKLDFMKQIEEKIIRKNISYDIYSDIKPDPSIEDITKALSIYAKADPDILIAIGGGSAIDAAKAVLYFAIQLQKQSDKQNQIKKPIFIAIPTTSGTGSEVTSYSVVTDVANEVKIPLTDKLMLPDVAILEGELTKSVPARITADTGMDVLTHALEALVSKKATLFTDMLAEKAIKLVFTYLPQAFRYGDDMNARRNLHIASCMAGIAFENATLGVNHSLAHTIGARFHVSHGRSNAMLLPYVVAFNSGLADGTAGASETGKKYAKAAHWIGYPAKTTEESVKNLIVEITRLNQILEIPTSLHKVISDENKFQSDLSCMTKAAMKDICTEGNPKEINEETLIDILKSAY